METKKTKEEKKEEFDAFLREKKARDGRLNKLGEWLLSGKSRELGCRITPDDMKSVLKDVPHNTI